MHAIARAIALTVTLGFVGFIGSTLSACASWCPPEKEVTARLPGPAPADIMPDIMPDSVLGRRGADLENCACTLEYRMNLCVTVNGADTVSPALSGVSFVRVRENGMADTIGAEAAGFGARCFGEWRGVQRVLMLRDTTVIDSSGWFEVETVDCCHGEAKTVDFTVGDTK